MLPFQLLRVRITGKGRNIFPVFCDINNENVQLASTLIKEFEQVHKNKERKGLLLERIYLLESQSSDYKLIRGLFLLLERRCMFSPSSNLTNSTYTRITSQNYDFEYKRDRDSESIG